MIFKRLYLLASCVFVISLQLHAQSTFPFNGPKDIRPDWVAITHAQVQVDPKTLLKNATLIIHEGKIENIGIDIPIPKEALVIEGKGRYIYASFIDLYSQYGINWVANAKYRGEQYSNNHKGAYAWNDAIKTDNQAADFFQYDEKKSKQYLNSGIGSTLSMVQDGIFRGSAVLVLTGKDHEQKLVIKQKAAAGLSFNKGSSLQDYPSSAMGSIALIRQTYLDAQWYSQQKEEQSLSFETFNQIKNLPQIFEAENKLSVLRAAKIAKEFGLTYIIKGNGDEYQRLDEIALCGMPLILPLNFPKPYEVEDPLDAINVKLGDLKHWEMAPANPALINKKNILFAFTSYGNTDAAEFLKNLKKAVEYGLSEEAALAALTTRPAQWMGVEKQMGTLQKGMLANFFVCNEPLFQKESAIEEHWIRGKQNILKSIPSVNLSGEYSVQLDSVQANLSISSKNNKTEGNWKGTDTLKVSVAEQGDLFLFAFKENRKSEQKIRINVWITKKDSSGRQARELKGTGLFPDGHTAAFTATLLNVKPDEKKKDSIPSIAYGQVIFPFTEYGNEQLPQEENFLFKNSSVWTNEKEGILTETDVYVSKGKIVAIGKNLKYEQAKTIDARGKHLTNGIIDEHSHIAIYRGVNECTQNNTSEVRIGDVVNSEDINIYRQLSGGVIACQQLHGSCNPIGGQSSLIKLRWGMPPEKMKIAGADGFIKFALGENVKQSNWGSETGRFPQSRMGVEQVYYDAFIRAREYETQLKANPKATRRDLEMDALLEILNSKRFISCHSYVQSEINMLMHVADSMKFRINTFTHILEGYKVADKMKAHGVNASTFADWWAYKYEVMEAIPQNAVILNKMGVVTAINSDDAEMGRRLNQEAAKMIKYGNMSEIDAWKMVTLNPAKMLHLDAHMGSIRVGKDADLVLWSANPLAIDAKAEMTLVDGICYFSHEQETERMKSIQKERQRIIQKMILAKQNGEKTEKKVSAADPDYHCED